MGIIHLLVIAASLVSIFAAAVHFFIGPASLLIYLALALYGLAGIAWMIDNDYGGF